MTGRIPVQEWIDQERARRRSEADRTKGTAQALGPAWSVLWWEIAVAWKLPHIVDWMSRKAQERGWDD